MLKCRFRIPIRTYSSKPKLEDNIKKRVGLYKNKKNSNKNYISFKDFPKVPNELINKSTTDLYEQIYMKPIDQITETKHGLGGSNNQLVEFEIPKYHSKEYIKAQLTDKDHTLLKELDNFMNTNDEQEMLQSQLNLVRLYYDKDSFNYQLVPEHSLKKSLSGMVNLNKHLNDIEDDYLWNLIPQDKLFGKTPFESNETFDLNNFKNWEQEKILESESTNDEKIDDDEYKYLLNLFSNSQSFYKKVGSRYKLDRKLLKDYKQLKSKGKLPANFKLGKAFNYSNDFEVEFEIENNDYKKIKN